MKNKPASLAVIILGIALTIGDIGFVVRPLPAAASPVLLCGVSHPANPPYRDDADELQSDLSAHACWSYVDQMAQAYHARGVQDWNLSPQLGCRLDDGSINWGPVGNASDIPSPCINHKEPPPGVRKQALVFSLAQLDIGQTRSSGLGAGDSDYGYLQVIVGNREKHIGPVSLGDLKAGLNNVNFSLKMRVPDDNTPVVITYTIINDSNHANDLSDHLGELFVKQAQAAASEAANDIPVVGPVASVALGMINTDNFFTNHDGPCMVQVYQTTGADLLAMNPNTLQTKWAIPRVWVDHGTMHIIGKNYSQQLDGKDTSDYDGIFSISYLSRFH